MYAGHVALGISARRWTSAIPLWLLVVASQLSDWMDFFVCSSIPGFTRSAMFSHSIPAVAVMALIGLAAARMFFGSWQAGGVIAALILSHILGDYVTGLKPTWPGGPVIGLHLYVRPLLDFIFETGVIVWGWWMYRSTFRPIDRSSRPLRAMLFGLILFQAAADIAFTFVPGITKCG